MYTEPEITPHEDINDLLGRLATGLEYALGRNRLGMYLTGSLTYGDFDRGSSDIDLLIVTHEPMSASQRSQVEALHAEIAESYPEWASRIEASYITQSMLTEISPPGTPRPYFNGGAFWNPDPPYGNEWLLNLYVLHECGVALVGPPPPAVVPMIPIELVREASRRDLRDDWLPRLDDPGSFADPHQQAYAILTLCRILHRGHHDGVASKRVASVWVRDLDDGRWRELIDAALRWRHGQSLRRSEEVVGFIRYIAQSVLTPGHPIANHAPPGMDEW